jgi:peptidoglycan hydrolase CwlO-like protein
MTKQNDEIIQAAIEGFEARKRQINQQIAELRGMLSGASTESVAASPANGPRTMSAASRKRIADAMRKRWAAAKKGAARQAAAPAPKKAKRRLSPEGRRRIIEATKERWGAAATKRRK